MGAMGAIGPIIQQGMGLVSQLIANGQQKKMQEQQQEHEQDMMMMQMFTSMMNQA